ncbi:MAG: adenine-specific methyltransferase EcoRI family protein [Bacteroidales bacterium]|jgi:hypothetical protein|nr:adenine-specific methyltransferase EcoRI family protein [Bacteroidales bacterium]
MAKSLNKNLKKAKNSKNDEFYTELTDIEKELRHYKEHFKGKTVFCNCDDPRISNFFHYFSYNFENLGLKRLITTCYKNQERDLFSNHKSENAIWLEYTGDKNGDRVPNPEEIGIHKLKGDGDFRSQESIDLLTQADIVVTNPPFSLFREYVAQLIEHEKKFLIIGNQNVITYKEIFKLIKENKLWAGIENGGTKWFRVPEHYDIQTETRIKTVDGQKFFSMGSVYWFTNLENRKRNEDITLYKTYIGNEKSYPKYDYYDAIEVSKVSDIPIDYKGAMGVPITFLDKYNPEQFEILDGIGRYSMLTGPTPETQGTYLTKINGVPKFARVIIKNKRL